MPPKPSNLTPLGILIDRKGLAIPFVINKSGIDRKRLVYLRTVPKSSISLEEAEALAPVFEMSIGDFAAKLREIAAETAGESAAG